VVIGNWFLFAVAVFFGGSVTIAMRAMQVEVPPMTSGAMRSLGAGAIFLLAALALRSTWPTGRGLVAALIFGVFQFGLAAAASFLALRDIAVGVVQVFNAALPLFTLLLASIIGQERLRPATVLGAVAALAGVAIIALPKIQDGAPLLGLLAALAYIPLAAVPALVLRGSGRADPIAGNATSALTGGPVLVGLAWATGEQPTMPALPGTWWSIVWMIPFGTVGFYFAYVTLLRRWEASRVAYAFLLMPFVAISGGLLTLGELPDWSLLAGMPLVLLGVWLGAIRPALRQDPATSPTTFGT
jgi:drug/metabolite transporter (DMT)-like permease